MAWKEEVERDGGIVNWAFAVVIIVSIEFIFTGLRNMKKWLRVQKLRFISWCGFKLTSNERSEIAFWITRNVTKSNEETLAELNDENYYGDGLGRL